VTVGRPFRWTRSGQVDGVVRHGRITLTPGTHSRALRRNPDFPAGPQHRTSKQSLADGPRVDLTAAAPGGRPDHPLAATYGILLATVLGAMGLPHILVRFYTNKDGQAARRTTAFVLLLLACFYVFPAIFAVLGRLEAPGLYVSGQTDSVVLVLPRLASAGHSRHVLGALVAAGAFAAFLSTSSGLLISMSGALSHDIMGRGVRAFRTRPSQSGSS
jgi:Na+/proline symporter